MDQLQPILQACYALGGLGLIVGIGLAVASKAFYVYVDPTIEAIDEVLPGANCGGCGLPGCAANAEAIVQGKAAPNSCVAAGPETADAIAAILGVSVEAKEPDVALPGCTYGVQDADLKYDYSGLSDCRAAALLSGGMKVCNIGCLGLGSCAKACGFNALSMGEDNLPQVNPGNCTGCGACERACPKNIISLSSVTRRIMKEYTTDDCTTPCQRACPAGIDISAYVGQIAEGNYERAVQVIKERNPFPTVIGRICPRPCENDCRRQLVDEPVAINFLKRYAADYELKNGKHILPYRAPETNRKIAIVGGGIEGLSTAFFAARLGHAPTVYEATDQLGGLLRSAIARNRLPLEILDWDIEGVLEMGVSVEKQKILGEDIHVHTLLEEGHEAVFLASGGWDSRMARHACVELAVPGTYLMMDLLQSEEDATGKVSCHANTIVVGGGALALKAATQALRKGAQNVTILLAETEDQLDAPAEKIEELKSGGIDFIYGVVASRLYGENGHLKAIEYTELATSSTKRLDAQTMILAAGRFPELIFTRPATEEEETPSGPVVWEGFSPYKDPFGSSLSGLLSPGDVVTDFSAAIRAIAAGRRAAACVHQAVYGLPMDLPEKVVTAATPVQNVSEISSVTRLQRQIMPMANDQELSLGMELEKGFDQSAAVNEAKRCLRCGLICYKRQEEQIQSLAS